MCAYVNIRISCICVLSRQFHADKRLLMCIIRNTSTLTKKSAWSTLVRAYSVMTQSGFQ